MTVSVQSPADLDPGRRADIADTFLSRLNGALAAQDATAVASLFRDDGYWRDLLALSWELRTFHGRDRIAAAIAANLAERGFRPFVREDREITVAPIGQFGDALEVFFRFDTGLGSARGFVRLLPDPSSEIGYGAFTLVTSLESLTDFPEAVGRHRPKENIHQPERGLLNWRDKRDAAVEFADTDPEVVIVGGGQAGLTLAARLGRLGVPALVVDTHDRVGDNWRRRYHSLTLHNEICVNHMPYLPFPESWPTYIPKDMLGDWFEFYAMAMELNIWSGSLVESGVWDEQDRRWTVRVRRSDGSVRTLRPQHVVMATGVSGVANRPSFPGQEEFRGQILHSSEHTDALAAAGRTALVIGAGNSAHDIAQDLYLRGASVTMLQRSPITVVSLEPSAVRVFSLYSDGEFRRPLEDTDLMSAAVPNELLRLLHGPLSLQMAADDADLLDKLRAVGFLLDNGEDETGFYLKLIRTFGGYYLNVGASDLIIDRKIALTHAEIERFEPDGVRFVDGSFLETDLVVLATGYQPLQEGVRSLFGDDVADRVGPIWGPGPDGEQRGMWSRTGQDHFYVTGGSFAMCRIYSRVVALRIKAELEGLIGPGDRA